MAEKPEWLVDGVSVLLYTRGTGGASNSGVRKSTVLRVSTKTFTVEGEDGRRFHNVCLEHSSSDPWTLTRHVLLWDSDEARVEVKAARHRARVHAADVAVDEWQSARGMWAPPEVVREKLKKAISVLQDVMAAELQL
jgi:hypothetical protein